VIRLIALLADDISTRGRSRAERFLDRLSAALNELDEGRVWRKPQLHSRSFRERARGVLLRAAISPESGLKRVRLWRGRRWIRTPTRRIAREFVCVESLTTPDAISPPKPRRDGYAGVVSNANDVYCRYTSSRYFHDPFARWQHPAMLGTPDRNSGALDKDPDGSWIVAPIVRGQTLVGYVSADCHMPGPDGPKDQPAGTREIAFRCRVMDLIADLFGYVLPNAPSLHN
jgi:hypothetical protein